MLSGLTDILSIIVIFQLLFACFYLISRKDNRQGNLLLAGLFLSLALNLTDGYLIIRGFFNQHPGWAFIGNSFGFLYGPLLYFYTLSILHERFRLSGTFLLHLLPFLLATVLSVTSYHVQPAEMQQYILERRNALDFPWPVYLFTGLGHLQLITYLLLSFHELKRSGKYWKKRHAFLNERLGSLRFTLYTFSAIMILSMLAAFVAALTMLAIYTFILLLMIGLIFLYINHILLKAMNAPFISADSEKEESPKYAGSKLTDSEREQYLEKLQQHMLEKKPYLDAEISLDQLAAQLDISPRHLSQIINESLGQHFFDFINSRRIEEAQHIFKNSNDPKMTVLEVMYASGFNSKSSFNTLFKKQTGLTPSQYRRQHRKKLSH